jgi:hypothetical protein
VGGVVFLSVCQRITELASKSKICDFKDALFVDEKVCQFEVTMDYIFGVSVADLNIKIFTPLIN